MRSLLFVPLARPAPPERLPGDFHIDLQEASKWMTLGPKSWHTCSRKDQILEIRPHRAPVHIGLVRSLLLSGLGCAGEFVQSLQSLLVHMNKNMGISEAYGRAIGTNFGFSSIAQSPPPEPELPSHQSGSGALAREGGNSAKPVKPTLRTSGLWACVVLPVRHGCAKAKACPANGWIC